jgi:hypothetical protein
MKERIQEPEVRIQNKKLLQMALSRNFRSHELEEIARLIKDNRVEIERKWNGYFSR